jgi:NifU-like protein involved in Fe-S cluster formation
MSRASGVSDLLEPQIRELFNALDHAGEGSCPGAGPPGARIVHGEAGREELGTRVRFDLCLTQERLVEARYRAYGCPHTLATCEWLARSLEGARLDRLAIGTPLDWAQRLGVPAAKLGRLLVIEDALQAALTQS